MTPPRVFSRVALLNAGMTRTICGFGDGHDRHVAIELWRGRTPAGRFLLFAHAAEIIGAAVRRAREPGFTGRKDFGSIDFGNGIRALVWAALKPGFPAAVFLGRVDSTGAFHGKPTALGGPELEALALAIAWLASTSETTAHGAPDERNG